MDCLIDEIYNDLLLELDLTEERDKIILKSKVRNAVNEVKNKSNYPSHYTDSMILDDMDSKRYVLRNVALYDYNMVGAEFQNSHSENGISRSYSERDKLFSFAPFSRVIGR